MRKFTLFFSLVLTFMFSIGASAQWANLYVSEMSDDPVAALDEIDPNAYYVVKNTGRGGYWDECQEATQTAYRTVPQYGLRHVSDVVAMRATCAFKITDNGDGTVCIQAASGRWLPLPEKSVQMVTDVTSSRIGVEVTDEGYFRFTNNDDMEINGNADNVVGWTKGNGDNGKFEIYLVELGEEDGCMYLERILQEIDWDENNWTVGEGPGYYPQELVDEVTSAYDAAIEAQMMGDCDEARPAADELLKAYEALVNGQIPVEVSEGFFYMLNARDTTANAVIEDLSATTDLDAAYANGDDVRWSTHFNTKAEPKDGQPEYMWEVKAATDSTYVIRNVGYDAYLGNVTKLSTPYTLAKDVTNAAQFKIYTADTPDGFVFIQNNEIEQGLHAATSGQGVVNWTLKGNFSSAWKLIEVPAAVLADIDEKCVELRARFAQKVLNDTLKKYYDLAKAAQAAGKSYKSDATEDGAFPVGGGLVTEASQVFSNAKETSEGSYEGLFDGDFTSFFHTAWGNPQYADIDENHYLQIDLSKPVQTLILKYAERSKAQTPDIPCLMNIYATNDPNLLSADPEEEGEDPILVPSADWDNLGQHTFTWQYTPLDADGNEVSVDAKRSAEPILKGAGMFSIEMPKAYQYVRIACERNLYEVANSSHGRVYDGRSYWNISELRAYEAVYDPDCVYAHMDPTAIANLEGGIAAAETELGAEKATQATIDQLKAAYEAYLAVFPDKNKLNDRIKELKTFAETAVEGEDAGYFEAGAIAALNTAIAEAEAAAAGTLTFDVYNNTMSALTAAFAAFNAKLILPADGLYYIVSQSGAEEEEHAATSPYNSYVYAQSSSTRRDVNAGIRWGYADDTDPQYRANAMWVLKRTEDNKITLKNVVTGLYMGNDQKDLSGFIFNSEEPAEIGLRYARYEGAFNLIVSEGLFANAQPSTADRRIVVWNSAKGTDNSAFVFIPADYEATAKFSVKGTDATIFTMPFSATVDVNAYTVAGKKVTVDESGSGASVTTVELNKITGTIPAGTPFLVYPEDAEVTEIEVYIDAEDYNAISYVVDPIDPVNGFVGVLQPDTVTADALVWKGDSLIAATIPSLQAIAANHGYIVYADLPEVTEAGDLSLPIAGYVVQGIEVISVENGNVEGRKAGVFNLQGVRLNSDKNLPKGIYIINGRKVVKK